MRKALCFLILIMGITSLASGQGGENRLKVITWNILNGFDFGKDTARRSQYRNWIAHQQPDVVALEELCGYTPGKLQEDAASWGHAYSLLLKTTGYSVGMTSRYPIELKEKIIEGMHHGALHTKINGIDYLAVHLHPGSIRRRQEKTRILLSKLEAVKTENSKYIVLGDFNAHSPGDEDGYDPNGFLLNRYRASDGDKGPEGNIINGHLDYSVMSSFFAFSLMDVVQSHTSSFKERGSFPGKILIPEYYKSEDEIRAASQRIDYILVSPGLEPYCVKARVANEEENGLLSDHFPVVAEFDWSGKAADTFADHWQYIGIAVEEPGYTIWGTSPIIGDDGKVHLFVARWPGSTVEPGWRSQGEIAHYTGDHPEGPFTFSDVALDGTETDTWDKCSVHNPAIHRVGDQYVLVYIGNNNPEQPPHPANQNIGMAVSKSLYGPWRRVGHDGKILSPPDNPAFWNYQASNGVNNPALLQHPDGGFFLYFKSQGGKMGLAIADDLEGPYIQLPFPVTQNNQAVEDGYAFILDGKFCLLTTDNHGLIEKGGGILWKSKDGIHFEEKEQGFYPVAKYLGQENLTHAVNHYAGNLIKFERPQVLLINQKPAYLYAPSGFHFFGGAGTASYVLKYVE